MTSFTKLKKTSSVDKLIKALDSQNKSYSKDDRYWQPTVDKAGNGLAVIRFLPGPAADGDEAVDFVQMWSHGFKGPTGKWYIENSLTTINQDDPVGEYNSTLWNSGVDANKKFVQENSKRRLSYISNVLVIKDPGNPANEGKVFLYTYGKKIMDKIKDVLPGARPEGEYPDEDEVKFNPFNLWEGANFKIKIRKVEGYRNYDKSEFEKPSALLDGDDKKLEDLWKSEHSLNELVSAKNFKSYDELKRKLDVVMGLAGETGKKPQTARAEDLGEGDTITPESTDAEISAAVSESSGSGKKPSLDDGDDDFADFAKLAN